MYFSQYKTAESNNLGLKANDVFCFEGHENDLQKKVIVEILAFKDNESIVIATFVPEYTPVTNCGILNLATVTNIKQCEGFKVITIKHLID